MAEPQVGARRHAQPPALGAEHETKAAQRQDRREAPPDPLDALEDCGDARLPDDVGKKRRASERACGSQQTPAAACDHLRPVAHTWRRVSTCFRVSSIRPSWSSFDTWRRRIFEAMAT